MHDPRPRARCFFRSRPESDSGAAAFERELDRKPPGRFAAIITDVRANGVFVELLESLTYGFIATAALGDDFYALDETGAALVGRKRRRRFAVNDRLDVVVAKVDRYKRLIDFAPA
jgi:ribonuclease R